MIPGSGTPSCGLAYPGHIQGADTGMGDPGEDRGHPRLAGHIDITGIGRGTGHFVRGVDTGEAAANCAHGEVLEIF